MTLPGRVAAAEGMVCAARDPLNDRHASETKRRHASAYAAAGFNYPSYVRWSLMD